MNVIGVYMCIRIITFIFTQFHRHIYIYNKLYYINQYYVYIVHQGSISKPTIIIAKPITFSQAFTPSLPTDAPGGT